MTQSDRHALVVRGGWSGHQPVEITELFVPFLEEHGFSVRIEDSPRIYADVDYMPMVDLIVQSVSRSTIEMQQFDGPQAAVEAGAGMAGWHGGITASYRNTAQYSHMIGAEFVEHPGKHPDERTGEESELRTSCGEHHRARPAASHHAGHTASMRAASCTVRPWIRARARRVCIGVAGPNGCAGRFWARGPLNSRASLAPPTVGESELGPAGMAPAALRASTQRSEYG